MGWSEDYPLGERAVGVEQWLLVLPIRWIADQRYVRSRQSTNSQCFAQF